ncbi:MAG: hypothetical protein JWN33_574 [Candidatus Saccharibacteria bacterium]|nr:hypothetical protein [Candidatus Saccharibacteria bacterium]
MWTFFYGVVTVLMIVVMIVAFTMGLRGEARGYYDGDSNEYLIVLVSFAVAMIVVLFSGIKVIFPIEAPWFYLAGVALGAAASLAGIMKTLPPYLRQSRR